MKEQILIAAIENLERIGGKEAFLNEILFIAREKLIKQGCKETSLIIQAIDKETTNKSKEFLNHLFEGK